MKMRNSSDANSRSTNTLRAVAVVVMVVAASTTELRAQPIPVANFSFESQPANPLMGIGWDIDSWQKLPNPGYPEGGSFTWYQSVGAFIGVPPYASNPYGNLHGTQAGYILGLPGAGIFQDHQSTDWSGAVNGLNATYQTGNAYQLTVGLFGKGLAEGSTIHLSLYYRNDLNAMVTINSTAAVYSAAAYSLTPPVNLFDFTVSIPTVQATDAWAGRNIGIKIEAGSGAFAEGIDFAYWDVDNVRLTAVPEPGSFSLAALGLGGLLLARRWPQR